MFIFLLFLGICVWSQGEVWKVKFSGSKLSPLMTNAIFLSDLSETFLSDSSNFLKNKMFLHGFFFSSGYKDIENSRFFEFLTVWTYFSSEFFGKVLRR